MAAGTAAAVRVPVWRLTYRGRDVTREVARWVLSVTYTDNVHGEADDVEVVLADPDGRWAGEWCPEEGDRLDLRIGYQGVPLLPCGSFEVDSVVVSGPPSTVTLRAMAAGPRPSLRTRRSHAYEGQTLRQVATTVAGRHGLRVVGRIGDVRVERLTQDREDDLAFVHRLAERFGYVASVRGDQLVFHQLAELEAAAPVWTVRAGDSTGYRLERKTAGTYRTCVVSYTDPGRGKTVRREVHASGVATGDTYRMHTRAETEAQAEAQAREKLRRLNSRACEGEVTVPGNPALVAGSNVTLAGFGKLSGKFQVSRSVHRMVKGAEGYSTTIEVRGVR